MVTQGITHLLLAVLLASVARADIYPGYDGYASVGGDWTRATLTGSARFLGPLAAGCQVTYGWSNATASVTTLGALTAPNGTSIQVPSCTDSWTGVAIPFGIGGVSGYNGTFEVSAVSSIAFPRAPYFAGEVGLSQPGYERTPTQFAYSKLGVYFGTPVASGGVLADLRAGKAIQSLRALTADFGFISSAALISSALLNATSSAGTTTCANRTAIVAALSSFIANRPGAWYPEDSVAVSDAVSSFAEFPCYFASSIVTSLRAPLSSLISDLVAVSTANTVDIGGALFLAAQLAHWVSLVSTTPYTRMAAIRSDDEALRLADAAPIVPSAIAASLGITAYTALDTTVTAQYIGGLIGATVLYQPFTSFFNSSFTTSSSTGRVTISGATYGLYLIPAGATDSFLTVNTSNPVRTAIPIVGVAGFTSSRTPTITVGPASALVLLSWMQSQGGDAAPSAPDARHFRTVYETVAGSLPDADYAARDYTAGSGTALAVFVVDALLPVIPSLGANFIARAINGSDVYEITPRLFQALIGKPASTYTNTSSVVSILTSVYTETAAAVTAGPNSTSSAFGRKRRSLITAAELTQLGTIFTSIASSISASNTAMQTVLAQAQAAIVAGTTPAADAFIQVSKVAQVQATSIAAAVAQVAALVATGDFTTAITQAAAVQAAYTGDALTAAIAAAQVNTRAIQAAITPETTTSSDDDKKKLAIGLGVGLGGGLVIALIAAGAFVYIRKRRRAQATAPAAAAEAVEGDV